MRPNSRSLIPAGLAALFIVGLSLSAFSRTELLSSKSPARTIRGARDIAGSVGRRPALGAMGVLVGSRVLCGKSSIASTKKVKRTGLSREEVRDILQEDYAIRRSFVTGDISEEIYADNCKFTDPFQVTNGIETYMKAVKVLFNQEESKFRLVEPMSINKDGKILAKWEAEFVTKVPFTLKFAPYSGTTTLTVNDDGLVVDHFETWNSSLAAVVTSVHL
ncbi:hypothetical protein AAMO2058_000464300 [Amorphochlora amoebiformis]